MTAHAVIFLDHPPTFLNVAAIIQWAVLIASGEWVFLAAQKESGERANLFAVQVQIRHAQLFGFGLVLALVPDVWLGQFVFEEALLVVPGFFGGAFGQPRLVVWVGDGVPSTALGWFGEPRQIQALHRFSALNGRH